MSEIKAQLNYYRTAPRKIRLVVDFIRGKKVKNALAQLTFLNKKSALPVAKLLKSAISNAKHNFKVQNEDDLVIKKITVDEGPTLKRYRPRARGITNMIRKRTSHISVVLREQPQNKKSNLKNQK